MYGNLNTDVYAGSMYSRREVAYSSSSQDASGRKSSSSVSVVQERQDSFVRSNSNGYSNYSSNRMTTVNVRNLGALDLRLNPQMAMVAGLSAQPSGLFDRIGANQKNSMNEADKLMISVSMQKASGNGVVNPNSNPMLDAMKSVLNNMLFGSNGQDVLFSTNPNSIMYGGGGNDILAGFSKGNTLHGGAGNDVIVDMEGSAVMYGGTGNNVMVAGDEGSSFNAAGGGSNVMVAGDGDNEFTVKEADGLIVAGNGNNSINVDNGHANIVVGEGDNMMELKSAIIEIVSGDGNNIISLLDTIGRLQFGAGNDIVHANFGNNIIKTGAGNDTIYLNGGIYEVEAGEGDDRIVIGDSERGAAKVTWRKGDGNDVIENTNGLLELDLPDLEKDDVEIKFEIQADGRTDMLVNVKSTGEAITVKNYTQEDAENGLTLNVNHREQKYSEYLIVQDVAESETDQHTSD